MQAYMMVFLKLRSSVVFKVQAQQKSCCMSGEYLLELVSFILEEISLDCRC